MSKIIIYHGSSKVIKQPLFGEGKNIMTMVEDFIVQKI